MTLPPPLLAKATLLFGSVAAARAWFSTPQAALGGLTPSALVVLPMGAREVDGLLDQLLREAQR